MTILFKITILLLILTIGCDSENEPIPKVDTPKKSNPVINKTDTLQNQKPIAADKKEVNETKPQTKSKTAKEKPDSEITSISELWRTYKSAKATVNEALETNDLDTIITYLKIAGDCALELGRPEIASWQFNNIGHYSIQEFQKLTGYEGRMRKLAVMDVGTERISFLAETKNIFRTNLFLLLNAEKYLEQAQIIDDELEPGRRTETILRNREFITWVKEFTSQSQ